MAVASKTVDLSRVRVLDQRIVHQEITNQISIVHDIPVTPRIWHPIITYVLRFISPSELPNWSSAIALLALALATSSGLTEFFFFVVYLFLILEKNQNQNQDSDSDSYE